VYERTLRIGPSIQKLKALLESFRVSTRIWFDIIFPTTMMLLVKENGTPFSTYAMTLAAIVSFHAGHTYFNDVSDVEVDRQSIEIGRNQRALVRGSISRREMAAVGWLFVALSIFFVMNLPWLSMMVVAAALPLVLAYNFKPIHLSARPLITQIFWPLVWVLMFFFCVAAVQSRGWGKALPYLVFVVMFMGLGESITQDIRDVDNDAAGGRQTTVVRYGVPRTALFAWTMQALSLLAWVWLMLTYPLSKVAGMLSLFVIVVWLMYFWRLTTRLRKTYDKADARITHVGSMITVTVVNLITIGGLTLRI
jgi:4-hydroxybenzoate polyprenyltransferase